MLTTFLSPGGNFSVDRAVEAKPSLLARGSEAFWIFAEQGGLFYRAVFLWTIVFTVDLTIYFLLTQIVIPSEVMRDYLAPFQISLFKFVLESYILVIGLGYLSMLILKLVQNNMSDTFLQLAILLACSNYVHICHFYGGIFVIIAPIFLIITVTNVSIFLSPKLGRFALLCSLGLYFGSIALEKWKYLSAMSVVLENITVPKLFTNPTLMAIFAIIMGASMFIFEYFVIYIIALIGARTEQTQRLNLELEDSNRKLSEIDLMKDNFISMVSHDLRTPLTGIRAYAEIIRDRRDKLTPQEHEKFLDIIIDQSKRLGRLITDLLDVQRFEAGKIKLDFQELDLVPLLREAMDAFRGAAEEKNLSFTENIPDREILIRGHRDRLHQALANLLSNALKFTPAQGHVEVSEKTTMGPGCPMVMVMVKDNGPGIPVEMQKRVFEKFQQGDELDRNQMQGSGLGLALVREIIEVHGGEVGLSSEPGQGSTFYFSLPLLINNG